MLVARQLVCAVQEGQKHSAIWQRLAEMANHATDEEKVSVSAISGLLRCCIATATTTYKAD